MIEQQIATTAEDLKVGRQCMMSTMGQRFLVEVLDVEEDTVRLSCPGADYPVSGMMVSLEFHDPTGYNSYRVEVVEGADAEGEGMLLRRPIDSRRSQHRDCCRVPTDLTIQVKEQVHVRRFDAALLNLSSGGMLIETTAPFDATSTVEATISLPGEPVFVVLGKVVHQAEVEEGPQDLRTYGIRFLPPEPTITRSISRYIWSRLKDLYALDA